MMKKLKNDRILVIAFYLGGIYDLILGIGLLFFPDLLINIFRISKPDKMLFVQLTGLFLIFAGYCLLYVGYYDVKKLTFIGLGMVILRFSYLFIVIVSFFSRELEIAYLLIGFSDGIMALILLIPIILNESTSVKQLWHYSN